MATTGMRCVGGAVSPLSSWVESGVVMKEAVEGVVWGGWVTDDGVEVESGSTGVAGCVRGGWGGKSSSVGNKDQKNRINLKIFKNAMQ